jgi:hypothetical protein
MACRFGAWKNGAGLGRNNRLSFVLYLCMIYLTTLSLLWIMLLSEYNNKNNNNNTKR